jgi:hypothetical protein
MNYLHWQFDAGAGDVIRVDLDRQANVMLLDGASFQRYRQASNFKYRGGLAKVSPTHLKVPSSGHWHVVVDLGGYSGQVRASAALLS